MVGESVARLLSTSRRPLTRSLVVAGFLWGVTGLLVAYPIGRALCSRESDVSVGGYLSCQHGGGRLWQALFGAALGFFVGLAATALWASRRLGTVQAERVARRLLELGCSVAVVPAVAVVLLAFPFGYPWAFQGALPAAAVAWAVTALALLIASARTGLRVRAFGELALVLALWFTELVLPQLRIAEWLMVMVLAFPVCALMVLIRNHDSSVTQ